MEDDAARALGEPVIASVILLKSGMSKQARTQVSAVGGLVGIVATSAVNRYKDKKDAERAEPTDEIIGPGFLVATQSRAVLFSTVSGFLKQKLGEQVAEFGPGELVRIETGKAAVGVMTVALVTDAGPIYRFEASKVAAKKLRSIAETTQVPLVEL